MGSIPSSGTSRWFCALGSENLVVTGLKKAERGGGLVLRVVEMEGLRADSAVQLLGRSRGLRVVNLLEEPIRTTDEEALRVMPYEIATVWLGMR